MFAQSLIPFGLGSPIIWCTRYSVCAVLVLCSRQFWAIYCSWIQICARKLFIVWSATDRNSVCVLLRDDIRMQQSVKFVWEGKGSTIRWKLILFPCSRCFRRTVPPVFLVVLVAHTQELVNMCIINCTHTPEADERGVRFGLFGTPNPLNIQTKNV
jgi:hypothetical protein